MEYNRETEVTGISDGEDASKDNKSTVNTTKDTVDDPNTDGDNTKFGRNW